MHPQLTPVADAADRLGIGEKKLRRWHKRGWVEFVTVGPAKRQHLTDDEIDRIRAEYLTPRPVTR